MATNKQIHDIKRAIREVRAAKDRLGDLVKAAYPIGSDVDWDKRGYRQFGTVIAVSGRGGLRVRNAATFKEYWIAMYDIVGHVA